MKHQIICTYCENDFFTGENGFGTASASRGFPTQYIDQMISRGKYIPPKIPDGTVLTPELCELMPQSFSYFKLADGAYAAGKVKLTGRAPDGTYNSVAHFAILDPDESRCGVEYASSPDLITDTEAVPHGYCDDGVLRRGESVNLNKVMKFLSESGRSDMFVRMLKASLVCKRNNGKIIISDKPENILMWIGALNYALPQKAASALTFCTYTADPFSCAEDICGVFAKGTAYSPDKIKYPDVLFDMYEDIWPKDEPADEYCEYIANGMSHDYSAVRRFNEFAQRYFDFVEPTFNIDLAYGLYSVINGGIESVMPDTFKACTVLLEHSSPALMIGVSEKLISETDKLGESDPVSALRALSSVCLPYSHASLSHKTAIRECVCKCILMVMLGQYSDEQSFTAFYTKLSDVTSKAGFSLTNELMNGENRRKLVAILTYKPAKWKTEFAVGLLSDFIVKNDIPSSSFTADSPLGVFVCDIVNSGEKAGMHFENAVSVIRPSAPYARILCNIYCRAYSALEKLPEAEDNTVAFRDTFASIAASAQLEGRDKVFEFFLKSEDYRTLYAVYSAMMSVCDGKTASELYRGHYENCFAVNADYCTEYLIRATEDYYAAAVKYGDGAKKICAEEIFDVISAKKVVVPCNQACIDSICSYIELSPPSDSDRTMIDRMASYTQNVRGAALGGRLLCLVFALACERIDNKKDYGREKSHLAEITEKNKVVLTDTDGWEDYLDWILPIFTELYLDSAEIEFIYDRFTLSAEQSEKFFEDFAKEFLKLGKNESDYTRFCHFLTFVFKRASVADREAVASLMKKLNSKRMELLSVNAEEVFSDSPASQDAFAELISMPVKKTGFFGGLFKRK